jgi:NADH dehydrogenase FAD-containing subunit
MQAFRSTPRVFTIQTSHLLPFKAPSIPVRTLVFQSRHNSNAIMAQKYQQPQHIVVLGGAYAGLSAIRTLLQYARGEVPAAMPGPPGRQPGFDASSLITRPLNVRPEITLIDERDGFYHSVGAPLGQISFKDAGDMWIRYDEIAWLKAQNDKETGVTVLQGNVTRLDLESKTISLASPSASTDVKYDYLLVATGMRRSLPVVPESLNRDAYELDVETFEKELGTYGSIVIVGGGAVGIENAAELKVHFPNTEIILVHSRKQLLSAEPLSEEFKDRALQVLREEGVEVVLEERVLKEEDTDTGKRLVLSSGRTIECGKVIYSAVQKGANTG